LLRNSHDDGGAGSDGDLVVPAMYHGESDPGALLDVELGYAQVQGGLLAVGGGAAGDDVKLGAFLGDDYVVHILLQLSLG